MSVLLLLVGLAWSQVPATLAEVEAAAAEVAAARARGAPRSEVARLMRAYRARAEMLPADAPTDVASARRALGEAIARGRGGAEPRAALVAVVGEPAERLEALERAVAAPAPEGLRAALHADIAEQAALLAAVARWDAVQAEAERQGAALRAEAIRAPAPGLTPDIGAQLEARRAAEEAERLALLRDAQLALVARATAVITATGMDTP
ncbi:MAG: hypothetical protein H6736_09560 [Alphaproteobacteria bacterium]|nr:hypothetical protein [Alphaproteobacteria bacterium]